MAFIGFDEVNNSGASNSQPDLTSQVNLNQPTQPSQSSSGFVGFGQPSSSVSTPQSTTPDVNSKDVLTPIHITHPLEAAYTTFKGALDDVGGIVSGVGNILYTPIRVVTNMAQGKDDPFTGTIVHSLGGIVSGAFNSATGNGSSPEWEALKSYYGQYLDHPFDMVANHPVNTLLDIASVFDAGATSAGMLSRTGEAGDLLEKANIARKAGQVTEADDLAMQARKISATSRSGQVASTLEGIQKGINPFRLTGKLVGSTVDFAGSKIPAIDAFANWTKGLYDRGARLGLSTEESQKFLKLTDQLKNEALLNNQNFRNEIEPVLQPLINNPALADRIADGLDRPSLLTDPAEIALKDQIQEVFNKHVTEPERAGGILKSFVDGGYLEHSYEEEAPKGFFNRTYKSFRINAPNDKEAQILRFDNISGDGEPIIGTSKYNNFTEVNKDSEILNIENKAADEIQRLERENQQLLPKHIFDNAFSDLIEERKTLLKEKAMLTERQIAHPEDFQTSIGDFGNALELQYKSAQAKLIENNLKLQDQLEKLKNSPEAVAQQSGIGRTTTKFADKEDKLVANWNRIKAIQNEISDKTAPYNTNLKMFKDADGNLYHGIRPTSSELQTIGMQPRDLIDALDHRMKTSALNQAKLKLGDQLGQEFGTVQKPEGIAPNGEEWVLSKSLRTVDGQYYYLPKNVEEASKRFFAPNQMGDAVFGINAVNNMFKKLLYANPGSAGVHGIHLGFLATMGGLDPVDIFKSVVNKGDGIDAEFARATGGLEGNYFTKANETLKESLVPKTALDKAKSLLNPLGDNYAPTVALEQTDHFLRQTLYRKFVTKGLTSEEALGKVNEFMGNYANLTPFERNLQAVFPFYNWMKQSIPASARALTDQAAKLDFAKWAGTGFAPNDEQKQGKVDTGTQDANGNENYLNLPIPLKDLRSLFQDMPSFMYSRMSPGITIPTSLSSNQQNIFNTGPNFAKLNQIYDPNLPNDEASYQAKIKDELQFSLGQIASPFRVLAQSGGLNTKAALESIGIYQSTYDPKKQDYYSIVDAKNAISALKSNYKKAVRAQNLPQAAFYQRAIMLWQQSLSGK